MKLRYHSRVDPVPRLRPHPPASTPSSHLQLDEPAYGVAPGQTACLLDGDLVVGRATIAT